MLLAQSDLHEVFQPIFMCKLLNHTHAITPARRVRSAGADDVGRLGALALPHAAAARRSALRAPKVPAGEASPPTPLLSGSVRSGPDTCLQSQARA
eukprot:4805854-Pleurochrysis_carterae.AAC.3